MLIHLRIRDFAIVDQVELELAGGMSVVTGETGAGKSILIDALGLLLGDRADSGVIRHGAEQAEISAVFDLGGLPEARAWLRERDLKTDETECHLRRVVTRQGRSRAYIDGSPQPLQLIREFGEYLVDIHGQHEHQSLLKRDQQRQLLDDHAGNQDLLAEVAGHYRRWTALKQQIVALRQADAQRDARRDLLRHQVKEIRALALHAGELTELESEHRRLANAGRLLEACQAALARLYEDDASAHNLLSQTLHEWPALTELDPTLAAAGELFNGALIQVREACHELRRYAQAMDIDPARLAGVEQRLAAIHELARKHRLPAEELPELRARLEAELDSVENSATRLEQLEQQVQEALADFTRAAGRLSERRAAGAAELSRGVSAAMQELGMRGGRFEIAVTREAKPTLTGLDGVEFQVSANPGQPLRPLAQVASGGELSRISLAIQVIAARGARIPTLIFDEVDSGIGGAVAEVVGRQLRALGGARQVLCVTHLAQVAAQAHQHFKVDKQSDGATTQARLSRLNPAARVEEIARMLGGVEVTANTRAHAEEMIAGANSAATDSESM